MPVAAVPVTPLVCQVNANEIMGLMTSGNSGDFGGNLNEIHGQSFDKLQEYPTRGKRRNSAKFQEHPFEANDVKLSLDK